MDDIILRAKFLIQKIQRESFVLEENFNHRIQEYGFNPIHIQSLEKILDQLRALDGTTNLCRDTGKYL
jgi:hypothetical protein